MRPALLVLAAFVVIPLQIKALDVALELLRQPSDADVFAGFVLIGVMAAAWTFVLSKALGRARGPKVSPAVAGVLLLGLVSLTGCTRIEPGHVGIKVNLAGSQRGVEDMPTLTGWVAYNPATTQVFEYPVFVQTAVWTRDAHEGSPNNEEISFNSKEGLIITGDLSLSYQLESGKVPEFYVKFRNDDLTQFTHGFLRNVARDIFNEVAGKLAVDEIYGPRKEEFLIEVRKRLNDQMSPIGVHIEQLGFIGAPRPPQAVIDAINAKIAATQQAMRAENELRTAEAEAAKAIAKARGEAESMIARARGEAESNELLRRSISPELVQWRMMQVTEAAVQKWDGRRPMVEGGDSGLLLQIPMPEGAAAAAAAAKR